jgi:hypothetical protein
VSAGAVRLANAWVPRDLDGHLLAAVVALLSLGLVMVAFRLHRDRGPKAE